MPALNRNCAYGVTLHESNDKRPLLVNWTIVQFGLGIRDSSFAAFDNLVIGNEQKYIHTTQRYLHEEIGNSYVR